MKLSKAIIEQITTLPESEQTEVLGFIQHLRSKQEYTEQREWMDFSLAGALRGMEDEESGYAVSDIKEPYLLLRSGSANVPFNSAHKHYSRYSDL